MYSMVNSGRVLPPASPLLSADGKTVLFFGDALTSMETTGHSMVDSPDSRDPHGYGLHAIDARAPVPRWHHLVGFEVEFCRSLTLSVHGDMAYGLVACPGLRVVDLAYTCAHGWPAPAALFREPEGVVAAVA